MHVFPAEKSRRIRDRLLELGIAHAEDFVVPNQPRIRTFCSPHTAVRGQTKNRPRLASEKKLELEIPYSPELVRAFWLAAGGSILAAQHAFNDGVAVTLAADSIMPFPTMAKGSA